MLRAGRSLLLLLVVACGPASGPSAPDASTSKKKDPCDPLVALFDDGVLYGIGADGRVFGVENHGAARFDFDGARSIAGFHGGWSILGSPPDAFECASLSSGEVVCRGSNANGELAPIVSSSCPNPNNTCPPGGCYILFGPESYPCVPDWTLLPGVRDLVQIHGACGVDRQGQIACWGHGQQEVLPLPRPVKRLVGSFAIFDDGTLFDRGAHALVPGLTNVVDAASGIAACAVETDGSLYCWGDNSLAMVGDGTTTDRKEPVKVGDGFASVRLGLGFACGAMKDGGLSCWGVSGEAPNSPGIDCGAGEKCVASPTRIPAVGGVVQLASTGLNSAVVLTHDGCVDQISDIFTSSLVTVAQP